MELVAIVTALALIQLTFFAFMVGKARQAHGVAAPSMTGPDEFLREFRVHMNTLENVVVLIPAMWLFGYFVNPTWSAGIGLVFVASRFMYRSSYIGNPAQRSLPFIIGLSANSILVIGTIIGASMTLYKG